MSPLVFYFLFYFAIKLIWKTPSQVQQSNYQMSMGYAFLKFYQQKAISNRKNIEKATYLWRELAITTFIIKLCRYLELF